MIGIIGIIGAVLLIAAMFARESGPRGAAVAFGFVFLVVFFFGSLDGAFG